MPEEKTKETTEETEQVQVQEVVINNELINNKLNQLATMQYDLNEKIDKLIKKL